MRPTLQALALTALASLAGCAGDRDERPVSWAYIHPAIIVPNCATEGCHSTLARTDGRDLQDPVKARETFNTDDVDETLLRGTRAGRRRMPPDQPLPDNDIDLIVRWLNGGRPD